jgi:hypothetical protein
MAEVFARVAPGNRGLMLRPALLAIVTFVRQLACNGGLARGLP